MREVLEEHVKLPISVAAHCTSRSAQSECQENCATEDQTMKKLNVGSELIQGMGNGEGPGVRLKRRS